MDVMATSELKQPIGGMPHVTATGPSASCIEAKIEPGSYVG